MFVRLTRPDQILQTPAPPRRRDASRSPRSLAILCALGLATLPGAPALANVATPPLADGADAPAPNDRAFSEDVLSAAPERSGDDRSGPAEPPIGAAAPAIGATRFGARDPLPRVPDRLPEEFEPLPGDPLAEANGYVILGLGALPPHRGADRLERTPFLISRFGLGDLELALEGLDWYADALPSSVWRAGVTTAFELPRRGDGADERLARETELGFGVASGVFAGVELPGPLLPEGLASARLSVRHAGGGERDGTAMTLDADYFFAATFMWRLGVAAKVELADDGWVDSRFGVGAASAARAGVEPFAAAGGLHSVGTSVYSIVSMSPTLGLFARLARTELLGDAAASPLVARTTERFSGMGLFYLF